jgi:hypothetical protein
MRNSTSIMSAVVIALLVGCQSRTAVTDADYEIQNRTMFIHADGPSTIITIADGDLDRVDRIVIESDDPAAKVLVRANDDSARSLLFDMLVTPPPCTVYFFSDRGACFGSGEVVEPEYLTRRADRISNEAFLNDISLFYRVPASDTPDADPFAPAP